MNEEFSEAKKIIGDMTLTERERLNQECSSLTSYGVCLVEKALLRYFVENEQRILELQRRYQVQGHGLDIIAATGKAFMEDVNEANKAPYSPKKRSIMDIENAVQCAMVIRDQEIGSSHDQTIKLFKNVSSEFRPKYLKYMNLVDYVLEHYSAQTLQNIFNRITDHAA